MTMIDISNKLECSQSLISNWEAGKTFPHPKYYDKINEFLGINPKDYESNNVVNEANEIYQKNINTEHNAMLTLQSITSAHVNITESQKNISESNRILSESLKEMINNYNKVTNKILDMMGTK
jgi:transcriptional regulator with XRE-family HTH domain